MVVRMTRLQSGEQKRGKGNGQVFYRICMCQNLAHRFPRSDPLSSLTAWWVGRLCRAARPVTDFQACAYRIISRPCDRWLLPELTGSGNREQVPFCPYGVLYSNFLDYLLPLDFLLFSSLGIVGEPF